MPINVDTGPFTPIRPELMHAMNGDVTTAYVWAHIRFRSQITGDEYKATINELCEQLVLTERKIRRALKALRDDGWVNWERADWNDATNVYTATIPSDTPDTAHDTDVSETRNHTDETSDIHTDETSVSTLHTKRQSLSSTKKLRSKKERTSHVAKPTLDQREPEELTQLLADRITRNGSKPPTITKTWTQDIERMHRIDGRTWDEIRGAIEWSQADDFWCANIRSPKKLRKHFDQMRLTGKRQTKANQPKGQAAYERAKILDAQDEAQTKANQPKSITSQLLGMPA